MNESTQLRGVFLQARAQAGWREKLALLVATWFRVGLSPRAPATLAAVAAIPLVLLRGALDACTVVAGVAFLLGFVALAVWASRHGQRLLGDAAEQLVKVHTVLGVLVAFSLVPLTWWSLLLGLGAFLLVDHLEPYPARALRVGLGVVGGRVLGALVLGLWANLCLRLGLWAVSGAIG